MPEEGSILSGMDIIRVGVAQFGQVFEDKAANRERVEALLADGDPTDLCILPEMTLTGFSMNPGVATLDEDDHRFFARLARERSTGIVYGGVVEGRNVAILVDRDGTRRDAYAKMHLFALGNESKHYVAGTQRMIWTFGQWKILPAICYDLRFSYLFWDAARDIDLVVVPSNWPASRREHWRTLLQARAIENQVPVAGCNRVGRDPLTGYAGDSLVVGPLGHVLADAGDVEGVFVAPIERAETKNVRGRFPFLEDRLD